MTVQPQDAPKVVLLGVAIVAVVGFIGYTALNSGKKGGSTPPPTAVANRTDITKNFAGSAEDPMAYVNTIERYSAPPPGPVGNPFRFILPRDFSSRSSSPSTFHPPRPARLPGGSVLPFPVQGNPGVQAGSFPEIKVEGVLVDYSGGDASTYAIVIIDGNRVYLQPGDKLQPDLKVTKVTESGIWVQAAKERAFIEVSKSYRPTGIPSKA